MPSITAKVTSIINSGAKTASSDVTGVKTAMFAVSGLNQDKRPVRFWPGRVFFLILMIAMCVGISPFSTFAGSSITLTWNPSVSTNIAGYDIYYGTASGVYNQVDYVTGSTSVTITNLVQGTTYYFTGTAVNTSGIQSQFSDQIEYTIPNPFAAALLPVASPIGGLFALTINGVTGGTYVVQASTNLVSWTCVETNTAPFTFVDGNAGRFSRRFYRTFYLP
jgi:hypothetical protein